jgi:ABC-2 type transport system ATP-binding protein
MAPGEFLQFTGRVRGLRGSALQRRIDEVSTRLQLGPVLRQPIETLSKGFRRRVGLAQAILHDPPVLILDEPTDGLDPNQKHEVRELINAMAAEKIIVISTHILEEVGAVCTRAIIIAGGRIVADETPEALIHRSRYHNAVSIRLAHSADLNAVTEELQRLAEVDHTEADAHQYSVTAFPTSGAALLTVISELAGARRWPIVDIHLEAGRLDEVFRSITTQDAA